jgi:hypothetical protein
VGSIRDVDRIGQDDSQCIVPLPRTAGQETPVSRFGTDGSRRGLLAAAEKCDKENAAPGSRLYGSATTNGLPPSLALSSGTAATAS